MSEDDGRMDLEFQVDLEPQVVYRHSGFYAAGIITTKSSKIDLWGGGGACASILKERRTEFGKFHSAQRWVACSQ